MMTLAMECQDLEEMGFKEMDKIMAINNYTFKFRGKLYECIGHDKDFQHHQFTSLIKDRDYIAISNRIINQPKFGPALKEIK